MYYYRLFLSSMINSLKQIVSYFHFCRDVTYRIHSAHFNSVFSIFQEVSQMKVTKHLSRQNPSVQKMYLRVVYFNIAILHLQKYKRVVTAGGIWIFFFFTVAMIMKENGRSR